MGDPWYDPAGEFTQPRRGTCTRPPEGWFCSFDEGHTGPCHPHAESPQIELQTFGRQMSVRPDQLLQPFPGNKARFGPRPISLAWLRKAALGLLVLLGYYTFWLGVNELGAAGLPHSRWEVWIVAGWITGGSVVIALGVWAFIQLVSKGQDNE